MEKETEEKQPKGYEISAEQKAVAKIQQTIIQDINLKKWCVETAFSSETTIDPLGLAREILEFLTDKPKTFEVSKS